MLFGKQTTEHLVTIKHIITNHTDNIKQMSPTLNRPNIKYSSQGYSDIVLFDF